MAPTKMKPILLLLLPCTLGTVFGVPLSSPSLLTTPECRFSSSPDCVHERVHTGDDVVPLSKTRGGTASHDDPVLLLDLDTAFIRMMDITDSVPTNRSRRSVSGGETAGRDMEALFDDAIDFSLSFKTVDSLPWSPDGVLYGFAALKPGESWPVVDLYLISSSTNESSPSARAVHAKNATQPLSARSKAGRADELTNNNKSHKTELKGLRPNPHHKFSARHRMYVVGGSEAAAANTKANATASNYTKDKFQLTMDKLIGVFGADNFHIILNDTEPYPRVYFKVTPIDCPSPSSCHNSSSFNSQAGQGNSNATATANDSTNSNATVDENINGNKNSTGTASWSDASPLRLKYLLERVRREFNPYIPVLRRISKQSLALLLETFG